MGNLLRIATCAAIFLYAFGTTVAWKKANDTYEAKFLPALPADTKPVYYDDDPYIWVINAEDMVRQGTWRIRHTAVDNAPGGRDMHYSQSIAWMMVLTGQARAWMTGEDLLTAIPKAGIWVNPLLLAVFLTVFFLLVERRLGFLPAAIGVLWLATQGELVWAFHPYRPDHQTFHLLFALLAVVLLTLSGFGWTSSAKEEKAFAWMRSLVPPGEKTARWYFIAAGIAQALGLWTGAIVQTAFLALTVGAVGFFILFLAPKFAGAGRDFHPRLWRLWAISGAAMSLFMYAVEYFPNHLSWRLEVNHPLYALVWLASGELLTVLFTARSAGRRLRGREWVHLAIASLLILTLPATLFFGGGHVHVLRDAEYLRLLSQINEFRNFHQIYGDGMISAYFRYYLVLPLFLAAGGFLLFSRHLPTYEFLCLWLALALAGATLALGFHQQRWLCFYAEFNIWLMLVVLSLGWGLLRSMRWRSTALAGTAALLLLLPVVLFQEVPKRMTELTEGHKFIEPVGKPMLTKRFAVALGRALHGQDVFLMADAGLAAPLYYFGGLRTVGSFYWEDIDGLHDTDAFFDATDDAQAEDILRKRKITHVVTAATKTAASTMHFIRAGETRLDPTKPNLLARMVEQSVDLPRWLERDSQLIAVEMEQTRFGPVVASSNFRIWRVRPAKSE